MDFGEVLPPRARRAVGHVATRASGPPLDPGLRITLNFHPDRVPGGLPSATWSPWSGGTTCG